MDTMPFGKHKGENIAGLPSPYLVWVAGLDSLSPPVRKSVVEEIGFRLASVPFVAEPPVKRADTEQVKAQAA